MAYARQHTMQHCTVLYMSRTLRNQPPKIQIPQTLRPPETLKVKITSHITVSTTSTQDMLHEGGGHKQLSIRRGHFVPVPVKDFLKSFCTLLAALILGHLCLILGSTL